MIVEVCAASYEAALLAEQAGADRIELCSELGVGGITPSPGLFETVRNAVSLPIHVLIRPRSGDFSYSEKEFGVIRADIEYFKAHGADGIVCGALNTDNSLDVMGLDKLLEWSEGVSFTFHRAFDWIRDPLESFDTLQQKGVNCLLTSGKAKTAIEGIDLLLELNHRAEKTTVMPGAGIRPGNARKFVESGFKAIHLSGTRMYPKLTQEPEMPLMSPGLLSETHVPRADFKLLREVVQSVKL